MNKEIIPILEELVICCEGIVIPKEIIRALKSMEKLISDGKVK